MPSSRRFLDSDAKVSVPSASLATSPFYIEPFLKMYITKYCKKITININNYFLQLMRFCRLCDRDSKLDKLSEIESSL